MSSKSPVITRTRLKAVEGVKPMSLSSEQKLGVGSVLAVMGALGIIFGALSGGSTLGRPWSFLLGFVFGVLTGMGATLAISGLIDRGREG